MRTMFNMMRAMLTPSKGHQWTDALAGVENDLNNAVHYVTGVDPAST